MLFWTKLLTSAHAATTSIHPFLYLYYLHMLKFDIWTLALLLSNAMVLRVPSSAFWIYWVDSQPSLQGVLTGLLTVIGSVGILLVLSVYPLWTAAALPVAIITSFFDGIFYQPLEVLVDNAMIKILGDYKTLYENERVYGKYTMVIMLLGIGWSLDDDHDFDTLMVTVLISSMILFLLCLSTNVQQDMTVYDQHEETASFVSYYKPYSLFHEHLSHISEESSIDTTLNNDLNRKLIGIPYELAQQSPCPPTQSAAIVLINLPTYLRETDNDSSKIISNSFLCSMFTLGVIWGMTQSLLFVYLDKMNIPMHTIGAVGSVMIITDLLAQFITSMIYESQFWVIIVYSLLMISMICNALWLKSGHLITQLLVIFLQFIQGLSFQIIWLLATHKADNLIVSEYKRSIIKGSMAVLYHSIGPAVGVLWMAYLVSSNDSYTLVYQYAACITLISGFSSWNWINYCKL